MPDLYVSRVCRYWWETAPLLAREPRRAEDVDSRGQDHAADATRYGVLAASVEGIRSFDPTDVFPDLLPTEYQRRWARWEGDHPEEGGV